MQFCGVTTTHATGTEESAIVDAMKRFADHNIPLTRYQIQDLVTHYVNMLPHSRQQDIKFANNRPYLRWVDQMAKRHWLQRKAVRVIEQSRVEALSKIIVAKHIARIQDACARFYIKDSEFIFNMDQSGASLEKMVGRSLTKGYGPKERVLVQTGIQTKDKLDIVTVMPVVSAAGVSYAPVIVFSGIQSHYRRVHGPS